MQISNIHLKKIGYREKQLVEKVNALKPDLLFITGDFFTDDKEQKEEDVYQALLRLIRGLKATSGIYGVPGNYDTYLYRYPEKFYELKTAGIDILRKENRKISLPNGKTLWLAGLDETWDRITKADQDAKLAMTLAAIPPKAPVILLHHYPNIFGRAKRAGVNLVLAGHTHGGQIGIPFLIHMSNSANKSRYVRGLFDSGSTKMYVNRGIGTTNLPVRFLCRRR